MIDLSKDPKPKIESHGRIMCILWLMLLNLKLKG